MWLDASRLKGVHMHVMKLVGSELALVQICNVFSVERGYKILALYLEHIAEAKVVPAYSCLPRRSIRSKIVCAVLLERGPRLSLCHFVGLELKTVDGDKNHVFRCLFSWK